ncbi:MAG: hypothetical protein WC389_16810 [Lutibacter sp.]|jgi:hypothetical protein
MDYYIAFMLEATGDFDIVAEFEANNDNEANNYAEKSYPRQPWYVLDKNYNNING